MKVILGVSGCIAAYKSALILRLLQKAGIAVQPVMTSHAVRFLGPLTLEKLSGRQVAGLTFEGDGPDIEHISLARNSDLLLVAPATANLLGKFANGIADDFLTTLYLSTTTPVVLAPAMNVEMWRHPAVQANLETLRGRGVRIVAPEAGYLACGERGDGRLAEPEVIAQAVLETLSPDRSLKGLRALVTAGPTVEDLDPVRFLSNRSSGKMGYALARTASRRGAQVTLIAGPTQLSPPEDVELVPVRSAEEMASAVLSRAEQADVVVMAAAVADFTPADPSPEKIKKSSSESGIVLSLRRTTDILQELGRRPGRRVLVGFAAETSDLEERARDKLKRKNLDLIVANDVTLPDSGFTSDGNTVTLIPRDGQSVSLPRLSKDEVAGKIWDEVARLPVNQH